MNQPDEELTRAEREAIASLTREATPPPALEDSTVRALSARGLLKRTPVRARRLMAWGLAAAAAILFFAGGYAAGHRSGEPATAELPRFVLLLYEGPEYRAGPAGQEQARVREYVEWAAELAARGALEAGEKLRDEADLVVGPGGRVESTPIASGETRLAGFFLVQATDDRAALEIARSCPHVRYGGSIVVREIAPTSPG